MGDRILEVNGTDVAAATHQEAVTELLRPAEEIKLTIRHDPLPVGFQVKNETKIISLTIHPMKRRKIDASSSIFLTVQFIQNKK